MFILHNIAIILIYFLFIRFVPIALLQNCRSLKYYTIEPYINGDYIKYNGNDGYVNRALSEASEVAQSFSHFSYEDSNETLIVVDVQGNIVFC